MALYQITGTAILKTGISVTDPVVKIEIIPSRLNSEVTSNSISFRTLHYFNEAAYNSNKYPIVIDNIAVFHELDLNTEFIPTGNILTSILDILQNSILEQYSQILISENIISSISDISEIS